MRDRLLIAGDALTAANMYAYCNNNPVMYTDHTGELGLLKRLVSAVVNVLKTVVDKVTGKATSTTAKVATEEKAGPEAVGGSVTQKAPPNPTGNAVLDALISIPIIGDIIYWIWQLFNPDKPKEWPKNLIRGTSLQDTLEKNDLSITSWNSSISVTVSGNKITIRTGFNFIGGQYYDSNVVTDASKWQAKPSGSTSTYEQLFRAAIPAYWEGTSYKLFGHPYSVEVDVIIDNNRANKIDVMIGDLSAYCYGSGGPKTVVLYMSTYTSGGAARGSINFQRCAAHEFGHNLGLTHDSPNSISGSVSVMGSVADNNFI